LNRQTQFSRKKKPNSPLGAVLRRYVSGRPLAAGGPFREKDQGAVLPGPRAKNCKGALFGFCQF